MEEKQNKLLIKNMVCQRCVLTVENIFNDLKIPFHKISLGEVDLESKLSDDELKKVDERLNTVGFELIEKRVNKIIADIKKAVIDYLSLGMDNESLKLSSFIIKKIPYD